MRVESGDDARRQEVADVRDDPVIAKTDRSIVTGPVDRAAQTCHLIAQALDQFPKWPVLRRVVAVAGAVDLRQ